MSVMTAAPQETRGALPRPSGPDGWTTDDLERTPDDDGFRYEILDGMLVVNAVPLPKHQFVVMSLFRLLGPGCPADWRVFPVAFGYQPDRANSVEPDLIVVRREDIGPKAITRPLVLAVEVLSPSTRGKDLVLKRALYERTGVPSYWVVDPEVPEFTAYELRRGRYVEAARAKGDDRVEVAKPFPVTVCPAELLEY